MYIATVPNRTSPPCILLRESYREGPKVCTRTLANVAHWPRDVVEGLRSVLKGGVVVAKSGGGFEIVRSLPHGHVAAVLGTLRRLGLDKLIASRRCREPTARQRRKARKTSIPSTVSRRCSPTWRRS